MDQSMKHFLLEEEHNASFKRPTSELIAAHRRFLQQGYHEGLFLLSGTIPPASGILIARAESQEALSKFLADKQNCNATVMQFNRIIEFEPIQHQFLLNNWFGKYSG
jgi:uncharacterized protein YciI